jgi:dimethylaniline monooxygenase (N-oxide forming)
VSGLRVAVVGAGVAGLVTAKVLSRFGRDVTVFERCPDVGGVWSATRRYPGLRVQNVKSSYAFSNHRFPRNVPEWPSGEEVQAYLESHVERFGLSERLRLGTEVLAAELDEASGTWTLETAAVAGGEAERERFDHLVVTNGVFSEPHVPAFDGGQEHAEAGAGSSTRPSCGISTPPLRAERRRGRLRQVGLRRGRGGQGRDAHHGRRAPTPLEDAALGARRL